MGADASAAQAALPAELPLLLFHAAGVALGVEAAAVEGILDRARARRDKVACRDLAELLGTDASAAGAPAKQLLLRGRGGSYGVGIDSLDEIVAVPLAALQPLPALLTYFRRPRAFWGGIVRAGKVVLLIDADRLLGPAPALDEAL